MNFVSYNQAATLDLELNKVTDTIQLGPFYWFGGAAGEPLPSLVGLKKAKHTKADATGHKGERLNSYILNRSACEQLNSLDEVIERLFGAAVANR